jgi:hypothetical protein
VNTAASLASPSTPLPDQDTARCNAATYEMPTREITYAWPSRTDPLLESQMIALLRETSAASPVIGFGPAISDAEAATYIEELRANLAAGKWRLLTIRNRDAALIGLCTLRRNFNPNNRHLADLCKGMIAEKYRGGIVLPAGLYEIALQCEVDGVEVLTLDVRVDAPARTVWEKSGFIAYGRLEDYSRVNGQTFNGLFMAQSVSQLKARTLRILRSKPHERRWASRCADPL